MKNAIIVHGRSDSYENYITSKDCQSNSHWIPWLQWELIKAGIPAQTPEMPKAYFPDLDYSEWAEIFEQFRVDQDSILVGHSVGGGFLLKYLSLHPKIKIKHLVMVAPSIDVAGRHPTFFKDFVLTPSVLDQCGRIDLFHSVDDSSGIKSSVEKIQSVFGDKVNCHIFNDKGHFTERSVGKKFPELLDAILAAGA
jgi:predicted alpha/beta hydrolase family esterase